MSHPWLEEQQHTAALETPAPLCADCRQPIRSLFCLPVEEGYLCRRCVELRLVEVESL